MKRQTWIYIAIAAAAYWYFMKKKKTSTTAPNVKEAASTARQIVAEAVDQTTFLPDQTTDADRYAADKSACR